MNFGDLAKQKGVPAVACERPITILDDDGSPLTLTDTYQASDVINVEDARELVLLLAVNAGAAANAVSLLPLLSGERDKPLVTDDAWFFPGVYDGAVTAGLPAGTILSGADFTLAPNFGKVTLRPTEILLEPTDAGTDEIRIAIPIKVSWARWFHCQAADVSAAGTLADITIRAVRQV